MTYLGSKAQISKYIVPILQKYIDNNNITTFIDCCCGGANIIKNIVCENRIGIDKNPYLIALLQQMQTPNFSFPEEITREDWDRCKNGYSENWFIGLVSIFGSYFTRGFSGGYCNDKHPGNRYYYKGRVQTAIKDIPLIQDVQFINEDFSIIENYTNCVIYCDPPYQNTKKYDFCADFNYNKFWECIRKTSKNNYVFISEQEAPNDFISIWSLDKTRYTGTTKNIKKIAATEHLFIYSRGLIKGENYDTIS